MLVLLLAKRAAFDSESEPSEATEILCSVPSFVVTYASVSALFEITVERIADDSLSVETVLPVAGLTAASTPASLPYSKTLPTLHAPLQ